MANLLVVDDEQPICESINMFMSELNHTVFTASNVADALKIFTDLTPEVVILDIRLPDGSGLEVLKRMHQLHPMTKVIMITAFQDMETTIEAMKLGAYDYLHKPLDADEVSKTVQDAVFHYQEEHKVKPECQTDFNADTIVGKSRAMKEIYKMIGMLSKTRATALIMGETGTGKELLAKRIHLSSENCSQPFVTFDCSAVVETLMESELFGHEKGAFTGAVESKPGKIELAGEGTLFLDEIGELPLSLQGKLLGFLERKKYTRVGGKTVYSARCRIIAATNKDLLDMVRQDKFRDDLYYRLKVVTLFVPPLRKRISDIDDLVSHFSRKIVRDWGIKKVIFQNGCIERLKSHPWTGNVRELENIIVAASVQARGNIILLDAIDTLLTGHELAMPTAETSRACSLSEVENLHILKTLKAFNWNKTKAARQLEISLPTLRKKISKYNLSP